MSKYPQYTMLRIDDDTKLKLREISEVDSRNMSAELRWLVIKRWEELKRISTTQQSNSNESVSIS